MSYIVHGPQGCGKSLNAQRLMLGLGLSRVVEEEDPAFPRDLYRAWRDPVKGTHLKARGALFLTHEAPPADLVGHSRVLPFDRAMRMTQGVQA